jgi:hypothetical protein
VTRNKPRIRTHHWEIFMQKWQRFSLARAAWALLLVMAAPLASLAASEPRRAFTEDQVARIVSDGFAGLSRDAGSAMSDSATRMLEKSTANGLTFSGNFSFDRVGDSVTLKVQRIDNDSTTRTTGTLRLELWASLTRPAQGQGFTGYKLAAGTTLGPLSPRTFYSDVVRTATFTEPPAGTYWMIMVLSEFDSVGCSLSDRYCLTDSGIFSTQQTFGTPAPPPAPSGNVTVLSRPGNQCYENIPRAVYDILARTDPALFQAFPSTTSCASLGMPFFAGLLAVDASVRVYTTDAATAQLLCSIGTITGCTSAPPPPPPASGTNFTDLWWNANESGWGVSITHHATGVAFIAWYTYDGFGAPKWYVASECRISNSRCTGTLYETSGPAFGPTFNPAQVSVRAVGSITFSFTSANNGTMSYQLNGASGSKAITRQGF